MCRPKQRRHFIDEQQDVWGIWEINHTFGRRRWWHTGSTLQWQDRQHQVSDSPKYVTIKPIGFVFLKFGHLGVNFEYHLQQSLSFYWSLVQLNIELAQILPPFLK